jgi:hypothetical protein
MREEGIYLRARNLTGWVPRMRLKQNRRGSAILRIADAARSTDGIRARQKDAPPWALLFTPFLSLAVALIVQRSLP